MVRPASTAHVSRILEYCHHHNIGVVPQAGNTGLVGGSVGMDHEIIVSLERMHQIHGFVGPPGSSNNGMLRAQAGCILQDLQDFAARQGYMVPVDLGAKGTCQIGGNVSTNAGGSYYYRYGSLHATVLGLEVVLPNGSILNLGYEPTCHLKDNTGYDLKHLFIGAEGTLGIITNVAILCPRLPPSKAAAFLACEDYASVCKTLDLAKSELGEILAAFEFMDEHVLNMVQQQQQQQSSTSGVLPLDRIYPYSILVETHGSNEDHDQEKMQAFVEKAMAEGMVVDGALAQNLGQVEQFWATREACNPSVASQGYVYKYDVSLAVDEFSDFADEVRSSLQQQLSSTSPTASTTAPPIVTNWGHVMDGNLHLNVVVPGVFERDNDLYQRIENVVVDGIIQRSGSISAEHGLGQYKNKHMTRIKDPATLATMGAVKDLFDPNGIMNPGKYLPPTTI